MANNVQALMAELELSSDKSQPELIQFADLQPSPKKLRRDASRAAVLPAAAVREPLYYRASRAAVRNALYYQQPRLEAAGARGIALQQARGGHAEDQSGQKSDLPPPQLDLQLQAVQQRLRDIRAAPVSVRLGPVGELMLNLGAGVTQAAAPLNVAEFSGTNGGAALLAPALAPGHVPNVAVPQVELGIASVPEEDNDDEISMEVQQLETPIVEQQISHKARCPSFAPACVSACDFQVESEGKRQTARCTFSQLKADAAKTGRDMAATIRADLDPAQVLCDGHHEMQAAGSATDLRCEPRGCKRG